MKRILTTIRVSSDNKNWSEKMTIDTFLRRHKDYSNLKAVEICEVISHKEAIDILRGVGVERF